MIKEERLPEKLAEKLTEIFEQNFCDKMCPLKKIGDCPNTKRKIAYCICTIVMENWELREGLLDAIRYELGKLYPAPELPISN